MPRITYVNGRYLPHKEAAVHVEDRGYQFADGIYEVVALRGGRPVDLDLHLARWERSMREIDLKPPLPTRVLAGIIGRVAHLNRVRDGIVYWQTTRGVARRDHPFPADGRASVVVSAWRSDPARGRRTMSDGLKVITRPDQRWARCDIKSVALLPNVLAIQAAREAGADDAWLVDAAGMVTESTRSNAWIVTDAGELMTRPLGPEILGGVTRAQLIVIARQLGLSVQERPFTIEEAQSAAEAFMSSSSVFVSPVVMIDGKSVGSGRPGPVTAKLREAMARAAGEETLPKGAGGTI